MCLRRGRGQQQDGERHTRGRKLGGHAEWPRAEQGEDHARLESMNDKTCIYPGCDRPAVPPHPLGGPQPAFCDLEQHNALTAHQERQRLEREGQATEVDRG